MRIRVQHSGEMGGEEGGSEKGSHTSQKVIRMEKNEDQMEKMEATKNSLNRSA